MRQRRIRRQQRKGRLLKSLLRKKRVSLLKSIATVICGPPNISHKYNIDRSYP